MSARIDGQEWRNRLFVVGMAESFGKSGSEHGEQVALFAFLAGERANGRLMETEWMHAIANGGSRGDGTKKGAMIAGGALKAEGVRAGVADTFLPVARHGLHGLYIEMKPKDGGNGGSKLQKEFGAWVQDQGYGWMIANGWRVAALAICEWLGDDDVSALLAE